MLWRLPATQLAGLLRSRRISARDAVQAALDRLYDVNGRIKADGELVARLSRCRSGPGTCHRDTHAGINLGRSLGRGTDVDVEDLRRYVHRRTRVWDVHDPGQPAFDGRRTQDHVGLDTAVAELGEVVDGVQTGPLVGQVRVEIVLDVVERDRGSRERQPLAELEVDVARHEDRVLADAVGLHPALDQVDVQVQEPTHLDGAAEGDLPVSLGEVQVTHR